MMSNYADYMDSQTQVYAQPTVLPGTRDLCIVYGFQVMSCFLIESHEVLKQTHIDKNEINLMV